MVFAWRVFLTVGERNKGSMGYEEIKLLKQSAKSTVHLVRERTVPVGTDRSELELPDTLEAYVSVETDVG